MAPCGAPVHRRRRGGELRHLALPHRRRRAVGGVGGRGFRRRRRDRLACRGRAAAVAGAARGRTPNRSRHTRYRPRRRRRGPIGPGSPWRCRIRRPVIRKATRTTHRTERTRHSPHGDDLRQRRRVGRRRTLPRGTANALLAGFAAHLAQRVGRVTADGSVTLTIPVSERTPTIPAPTHSRMSTSRSTPHLRGRTCARSVPQSSKR